MIFFFFLFIVELGTMLVLNVINYCFAENIVNVALWFVCNVIIYSINWHLSVFRNTKMNTELLSLPSSSSTFF